MECRQDFSDSLLDGLPFAFVYLDDILVASTSAAEHRRYFCAVFALLEQSGLVVNTEECIFGCNSIEFCAIASAPLVSAGPCCWWKP
jgi:hypothetical protein